MSAATFVIKKFTYAYCSFANFENLFLQSDWITFLYLKSSSHEYAKSNPFVSLLNHRSVIE